MGVPGATAGLAPGAGVSVVAVGVVCEGPQAPKPIVRATPEMAAATVLGLVRVRRKIISCKFSAFFVKNP